MWNTNFETRPLQPQSNPSLAANDPNAIGKLIPTSANALPSNSVPTTSTPDQSQIIVPKTLGDAIQYLVENLAQDTLVNNLRSEIERLLKVEEELKKKVQSLENILWEERQRAFEVIADLEKQEKSFKDIKTELQQREKDINQLRKSITAASQPLMETGIYSLNQIEPLVITGNWRSLFDDLHSMVVEELDKQLLDSASSLASEQYRELAHYADHPGDLIYSRHCAYAIVRDMSFILSKFFRRKVLNDDGFFKYAEREDLVDNLMKHIMATSKRSDFAKSILGFLASPNNIEDVSRAVFKEVPGAPRVFLEHKFERCLKSLHEIAQQYELKTEMMDASFKRIIYKAIYTTFQMAVISDSFVSFWSDTTRDRRALILPYEERNLALYTDKFNNSLETVVLPLNSEEICVVFTVFPGCLYVNTAGEIKVMERSQVVCCKSIM